MTGCARRRVDGDVVVRPLRGRRCPGVARHVATLYGRCVVGALPSRGLRVAVACAGAAWRAARRGDARASAHVLPHLYNTLNIRVSFVRAVPAITQTMRLITRTFHYKRCRRPHAAKRRFHTGVGQFFPLPLPPSDILNIIISTTMAEGKTYNAGDLDSLTRCKQGAANARK